MIDINSICVEGSDILTKAHELTAIPSLYIGFTSTYIILLIIGLIGFSDNRDRLNFFIIWLISLFVSGMVIIFLTLSPITIQNISNFIIKFFS